MRGVSRNAHAISTIQQFEYDEEDCGDRFRMQPHYRLRNAAPFLQTLTKELEEQTLACRRRPNENGEVRKAGILITSREYGATIMLLAAFAMLGLIVQRHSPRRRQPPKRCRPPRSTA